MFASASLSVVAAGLLAGTPITPLFRHQPTTSFYLIVVDGYPGSFAEVPELESHVQEFKSKLEQIGFHVLEGARANYSFTYAALSSALSMGHGLEPSRDPISRFIAASRGDHLLATTMREYGYRYVHVESGWSGSDCGPLVDACIRGAFFDDTIGELVDMSIFGHTFERSALTYGGGHALEELVQYVMEEDDGGNFVFAHVLLPHPPLQLTRDCTPRVSDELNVTTLNSPWTTPEELMRRKAAFLDQVDCLNRRMLDLLSKMPVDWPVVITSDHGSDFRGQLWKPPAQWDEADIRERFSILHAARVPEGCPSGVEVDLVNLIRHAASCVSGSDLAPVRPRYEIVPYLDALQVGHARLLTAQDFGP
jgi:hypothetical protein